MTITSKEMRELENSVEEIGITKLELMENAGRKVAELVEEEFKDNPKNKKVIIICGQGNNGGDGFVAARYLYDICNVKVLFIGETELLKSEASVNYDCLNEISPDIIMKYNEETAPFLNFTDYDVIIDAMLGTGVSGELRYPYSSLVKLINSTKAFKISIDIPTGLNPDTNEVKDDETYFKADLIITFHDTKPILDCKQLKDKVKIVDIGIPF
jgi:ADP-dependent NAD(P)H-hydrate dehydratase / NAD(P)H-hydrate epimerase